jgi:hypothetical protein
MDTPVSAMLVAIMSPPLSSEFFFYVTLDTEWR